MTRKAATTLSLRAYGKRRGVSGEAVRRAIKAGRLAKSVGTNTKGKPVIVDPELADREWDANTDQTRRVREPSRAQPKKGATPRPEPVPTEPEEEGDGDPDPELDAGEPELSPDMSLADASRADKYWSAMRRKLEYEKRLGELIPVDEVLREFADAAAAVKAKLRRIPDAVAHKVITAAKRGPNHVKALLLIEIDEALRELAKEGEAADPEEAA